MGRRVVDSWHREVLCSFGCFALELDRRVDIHSVIVVNVGGSIPPPSTTCFHVVFMVS